METNNEANLHQHEANPREAECDVQQAEAAQVEDRDVDSVMREIEAAERQRERLTHGLLHLPDGRVAVSEEMDLLLGVERVERTIDRIVSTSAPATKRVRLALAKDRYGYQLTKLGDAIWAICRNEVPLIEKMYPACRRPARLAPRRREQGGMRPAFNPRITVTLHACQIALRLLRGHAGAVLDPNQHVVRHVLDRLLRTIRRVCRSRRFKYLENNYRRNAQLRFEDGCKYLAGLFAWNSRLLILRVDLYFRPDHEEWADTEAAGRSIGRFLRALREGRVVPDMLGWAARLENGFRRGIHVHLLVAMDGHKHREAASWSKILGEAWVTKFSAGHGTYFNCYARKDWYKLNGLGLVHVSDRAKLLGVREALRYMTKPDFHLATGFVRNFRRGQPPSPKGAVKRGAPRKGDQGASLVDVILRQASLRDVARLRSNSSVSASSSPS